MDSLTHKSKKSVLPHQHRLHVFNHTKRGCFPFRFYFNTNKCIYTRGKHSRTSRTSTSSWWSSSGTSSSRYILLCIRIKSSYSVVLYLLWNLCNNHPFLGDTVVFQVTLSSTSPALTTDSDINDVSMYYCTLLLLPWVLCEICILSALFHDPSCFSFPKTKKSFSNFVFLQRVTLWNVEWQVQKSWLSQPRNVYIICPKHQIL